jgi:NAD(P)H-flavin reductase
MVAQMMEKGKVLMRVDGPYGRPYGPGWHQYDALVIIAGGIGESSLLRVSPSPPPPPPGTLHSF